MIPDGFGFADHVADILRSRGIRVEMVLKGNDLPPDAESVVYLKGAQIFHDLDDAVAINDDLFAAAHNVANAMTERGGTFITVQNTGGRFGFDKKINPFQAASAGAPALLKTAKQEWPLANLKAIDIDLPEDASRHPDVAASIADEICRVCSNSLEGLEVGLLPDERLTFITHQTPPSPLHPTPDDLVVPLQLGGTDVVLASGGARGVTAASLLELARRCRCKFVLLGRTPLTDESERLAAAKTDAEIKKAIILDAKEGGELIKPNEVGIRANRVAANREIRQHLQQFIDVGADVKYLTADVRDVKSIGNALNSLPQDWRKISVLIHGAGVIADKRIQDKTHEQFDLVFATKVNGFYALMAAMKETLGIKEEDLKAIAFFSSAAARSGNKGQSDYAMANEVLNKLAQSLAKKNRKTIIKSIGWGPWRGGMVSPSLEHYFESKGVELIELADGAAAFANELLHGGPEVEVCFGEVNFGDLEEDEIESEFKPTQTDIRLLKTYSLEHQSWLEDHSVQGDPIVPMVMVMQTMMDTAALMYENVAAWRFDQVSIRQGIRISKKIAKTFEFTGTYQESTGAMLAKVADYKTHAVHYEAAIRPVEKVYGSVENETRRKEEWRKTIYDGEALFHEGVFQVLRNVYNVRDHCISGLLRDLDYAKERIGDHGPRLVSLDACLQLVLLWIKANMNGIALPMSMEMATISAEKWPTEGVAVSATIEHRGAKHAKASAVVVDKEGQPLAVLKGIQSYIY